MSGPAVDTNLIVRLVMGDDPVQTAVARDVMSGGDVFVPTTVLLESAWVLRSRYGVPGNAILDALRGVCAMPGVRLESPDAVAVAFRHADDGMDIADAFHLAAARTCREFLTFDRDFARAGAAARPPVRVPA